MPAQTTDLFLLEDLEDVGKTSELAEGELAALQAVADWIKTYVVRPHKDLGRAGPVCPFVPGSLERRTLWLAPEQIGDSSVPAVVELMNGYVRRFLEAQPRDGDEAKDKVMSLFSPTCRLIVRKASLTTSWSRSQFRRMRKMESSSGRSTKATRGTALYNSSFRPFQSPVPFLFVRHTVISDWKFFLDDEQWLSLWARRFGESAVHALAEELRGLPWRVARE
jgi:hypothetical protein